MLRKTTLVIAFLIIAFSVFAQSNLSTKKKYDNNPTTPTDVQWQTGFLKGISWDMEIEEVEKLLSRGG